MCTDSHGKSLLVCVKVREALESGGVLVCVLMWIECLMLCLTVTALAAGLLNIGCFALKLSGKTCHQKIYIATLPITKPIGSSVVPNPSRPGAQPDVWHVLLVCQCVRYTDRDKHVFVPCKSQVHYLRNNVVSFDILEVSLGRSQSPRGLRRGSTAVRLLRSWVPIPPGSCMFVCCVSGRGLCDELITRPEESYRLWRVVVCD
jgi:hypothetical protein